MSEPAWSLHSQLEADTSPVGDLPLSRLLAIDDATYPWLVLVPRRTGAVEIADLGADASVLMGEIVRMSLLLKTVTGCDKINVGLSASSWCPSFTFTSLRGARTIRCGRSRSGAICSRKRAMRRSSRASLRPSARVLAS